MALFFGAGSSAVIPGRLDWPWLAGNFEKVALLHLSVGVLGRLSEAGGGMNIDVPLSEAGTFT